VRKFLLVVASLIVAWLAISLILGLVYATGFNPVADLAATSSSTYYEFHSLYTGLNGLLILVLTILLARPVYKGFVRRWGRPSAPAAMNAHGGE
jgi:hypothetical protein